jgi:hypothetical protein|uniref:Uncharacterized protein n=1 Tax=viral metagenome TaxID=1070528 RepID=A0A6C0AG93_9ZZZZ|tara:strand:+ start:7855 stop:8109 length:255 start_codon:yes stop_codon:yes gene_type:complete
MKHFNVYSVEEMFKIGDYSNNIGCLVTFNKKNYTLKGTESVYRGSRVASDTNKNYFIEIVPKVNGDWSLWQDDNGFNFWLFHTK